MRTKETVTIKATPAVVKLAQKANDIQDASNPLAVCKFLLEVQDHFRDRHCDIERYGADLGLQNPISLCVLNKLNHLAVLEQSRCECFGACVDLIEGKDVEWEVEYLN